MARPTIAPQLADLSQDIAGEIPLSIIVQWETGPKTSKAHKAMLSHYAITGTVVCSDSAGLSKLSQQKTLLEVMKMVHDPKAVVYGYGSAIGGKGIGVWAADNTEMFYPKTVPVHAIVGQMLAAQAEIKKLPVQIGLGIHSGTFIHIGGGLFGANADFVENMAENYSKGGEILLTPRAHAKLPAAVRKSVTKDFITELASGVYRVNQIKTQKEVKKSSHMEYPMPFSRDFFEFLCSFQEREKTAIYHRYAQEKTVVLVKIHHTSRTFLLDQFAHWLLANNTLCTTCRSFGLEQIKSNGNLGIFVTNDGQKALSFARELRAKLLKRGYISSAGIAKGEVLIFPLPSGGKDIAGNPVNIASKLAEDIDTKGDIWMEQSAGDSVKSQKMLEPFAVSVSHIMLHGWKIPR